MQSRDLLQRVGQALYGERWQSALAVDLSVADRTMRRWVADDPPPAIWPELRKLVLERRGRLDALARELERL